MKKLLLLALIGAGLTGCASNGALQKKTAFALGEDISAVQISNIEHGAYEATWVATTPSGKYNCSAMGGNVFTVGIPVSPSCIKVGASHAKGERKGFCNAMLRAAGKCK